MTIDEAALKDGYATGSTDSLSGLGYTEVHVLLAACRAAAAAEVGDMGNAMYHIMGAAAFLKDLDQETINHLGAELNRAHDQVCTKKDDEPGPVDEFTS